MTSPDVFASGSADNTIKLWSISDRQSFKTLTGHTNDVSSLKYLTDGTLASGSTDALVKIWNLKTGALIKNLYGHVTTINSIEQIDSNMIVSSVGFIIKWNIAAGNYYDMFTNHAGVIYSLKYLNNSELASSGDDGKVEISNVQTKALLKTFSSHTDQVRALHVIDSNRLASGSGDKTIKIWDISKTALIKTIAGHTQEVLSLTAVDELVEGNLIKFYF
jgi:WD40 repeat protein